MTSQNFIVKYYLHVACSCINVQWFLISYVLLRWLWVHKSQLTDDTSWYDSSDMPPKLTMDPVSELAICC